MCLCKCVFVLLVYVVYVCVECVSVIKRILLGV